MCLIFNALGKDTLAELEKAYANVKKIVLLEKWLLGTHE
jgi:hypothetical protein